MVQGGDKVIHKELSYKLVGIIFEVYNELGYGYQEVIYERAIEKCFKDQKLIYKRQAPYIIKYHGEIIGRKVLDFIVDNKIVLELKKGNYISKNNISQIKSYLAVTGLKLAIIAHFTSKGVRVFRALNPNN